MIVSVSSPSPSCAEKPGTGSTAAGAVQTAAWGPAARQPSSTVIGAPGSETVTSSPVRLATTRFASPAAAR